MSRSERLLQLLQALRRHRRPVSGKVLSEETGVSLRTLYRDIASLQAQGAAIEGERGVGYVLKPGFLLPPLMFSAEEIEALVLGTRWVAGRADRTLADAAMGAMAKIGAVLPAHLRNEPEASSLWVAAVAAPPDTSVEFELLRKTMRSERKLRLAYRDAGGGMSHRTVWPFALAFFEQSRVLMCWCELRQDFRNFRTDRIAEAEPLEARYPQRRQALLKAWRLSDHVAGRTILPEPDSEGR